MYQEGETVSWPEARNGKKIFFLVLFCLFFLFLFFLFFFFVSLPFLGPLPRHREVPRLGVESEL